MPRLLLERLLCCRGCAGQRILLLGLVVVVVGCLALSFASCAGSSGQWPSGQ